MTNSGSERPGEFELIAELFAPLAISPGAFHLKDDAAIIAPPVDCELAVTADALVEGVHFLDSDPSSLIARKALRVNLSDLAAKGCFPLGYLLVLSIPASIDMGWLRAFANGLRSDQGMFGVQLLGGDTTATPGPLTIAITAFGSVVAGKMIRRSGAKPGDLVFVSGTIGDAAGGLACLKSKEFPISSYERDILVERYRLPQPRVDLGQALREVANASIDVSDGLLADCDHIANASGARVVLDVSRIPLSTAVKSLWGQTAAVRAATAGDDYEIAFTAPPARRSDVAAMAEKTGVQVTEIGRVEFGSGAVLVNADGQEIRTGRRGFTHF